MSALTRPLLAALCLLAGRAAWTGAPPPPAPALGRVPPVNEAARFCRPLHFVAYSTLEPSGQRVEESVTWEPAQQAYLIKGPVFAYMLDDPGVAEIPSQAATASTSFRIAIRAQPSSPIDRFCEYGFQESAECDPHGDILYTQVYTGCDLQTLRHVVRLTPDSAGTLPLLDVSYQDVQGNFGIPLYLSPGSDLRLRVRN